MGRHIIDRATPRAEGTRVKTYLDMDRKSGLHPAIRILSQRPATRGDEGRKLREFARIERGQRA